jgi:hypothetical protein
MTSETSLQPVDFAAVFRQSDNLQLLLEPGLVILAVTDSYARATNIDPEAVIGKHLFEVFPDNPDYPHADGVENLRTSLFTAMRTKRAHRMPVQKYDIPCAGGGFEERFWQPCNWPILGPDGYVALLVHQVSDVTEQYRAASNRARAV